MPRIGAKFVFLWCIFVTDMFFEQLSNVFLGAFLERRSAPLCWVAETAERSEIILFFAGIYHETVHFRLFFGAFPKRQSDLVEHLTPQIIVKCCTLTPSILAKLEIRLFFSEALSERPFDIVVNSWRCEVVRNLVLSYGMFVRRRKNFIGCIGLSGGRCIRKSRILLPSRCAVVKIAHHLQS